VRGGCLLAIVVAACSSAPVRVSAARVEGGVYVCFERTDAPRRGHLVDVAASGGTVDTIVNAPDRTRVAVLWREPAGVLEAVFPHGGVGRYVAGDPAEPGELEYVFLEADGATVTARVPRACPLVDAIDLVVTLHEDRLPATFNGRSIEAAESRTRFVLPVDDRGGLVAGDIFLELRTVDGTVFPVVIGVDRDGIVSAVAGYARNWEAGLD
jgi:hypothetical protein